MFGFGGSNPFDLFGGSSSNSPEVEALLAAIEQSRTGRNNSFNLDSFADNIQDSSVPIPQELIANFLNPSRQRSRQLWDPSVTGATGRLRERGEDIGNRSRGGVVGGIGDAVGTNNAGTVDNIHDFMSALATGLGMMTPMGLFSGLVGLGEGGGGVAGGGQTSGGTGGDAEGRGR